MSAYLGSSGAELQEFSPSTRARVMSGDPFGHFATDLGKQANDFESAGLLRGIIVEIEGLDRICRRKVISPMGSVAG